MEPAIAWAKRREVSLVVADALEINATLIQPETNNSFYLIGKFDSYRALPPEWKFGNENWKEDEGVNFPANAPGAVFHGHKLICAPFNRLAYKDYNVKGPHGDWGGIENWLYAGGPNDVKAYTIGDMLACIWRDFVKTRGVMK